MKDKHTFSKSYTDRKEAVLRALRREEALEAEKKPCLFTRTPIKIMASVAILSVLTVSVYAAVQWIDFRMEQNGEGPAQMLPQILQSGETNFYPVFSSPEEGRELAEQCTFIRQSFLEAVQYAREHADEIEAIVVNALTEPFFLGGEIYPLVESMETRVIR